LSVGREIRLPRDKDPCPWVEKPEKPSSTVGKGRGQKKPISLRSWQAIMAHIHHCVTPKGLFRNGSDANRPERELLFMNEEEASIEFISYQEVFIE
jgi:hypothetical protein